MGPNFNPLSFFPHYHFPPHLNELYSGNRTPFAPVS